MHNVLTRDNIHLLGCHSTKTDAEIRAEVTRMLAAGAFARELHAEGVKEHSLPSTTKGTLAALKILLKRTRGNPLLSPIPR